MKKILVIEDEPFIRSNITDLLEAEDYQVVSAENGFLGVLQAQKHLPDLIICDVMMPEFDGRDVLNILSQDPRTAIIPFIFVSARADNTDIRLGMQLGADDYLTKPYSRKDLLIAISARIAKHQLIKQEYSQEYKCAEALQLEVQYLQKKTDNEEGTSRQLHPGISKVLPRLNIAIRLLRKLQPGEQDQDRLTIIKDVFCDEINRLKHIPDPQDILASEDIDLLSKFDFLDLNSAKEELVS